MSDLTRLIAEIRRPRLLLRAARAGLEGYRRDRDLARLLPSRTGGPALAALVSAEEAMEQTRRAGAANYSVSRHIEVLIALLAELRLTGRGAAV